MRISMLFKYISELQDNFNGKTFVDRKLALQQINNVCFQYSFDLRKKSEGDTTLSDFLKAIDFNWAEWMPDLEEKDIDPDEGFFTLFSSDDAELFNLFFPNLKTQYYTKILKYIFHCKAFVIFESLQLMDLSYLYDVAPFIDVKTIRILMSGYDHMPDAKLHLRRILSYMKIAGHISLEDYASLWI